MPREPNGQKRAADVIDNAVKVMRIATGEEAETYTTDGRNAAAVALGRLGGKARAAVCPPRSGKRIAKKATAKRWWRG